MTEGAFLTGKVGLITGGGTGVGRAIAEAVAAAGLAVGLVGRRPGPLEETRAAIEAAGGQAFALVADIRDPTSVHQAVDRLVAAYGRIDLLVNNAGISGRGTVESVDPATWRSTIETNLLGAFNCCQAVVPHLRAAGGGWIIGIASGASKRGYAGLSAYSASKAGLTLLNESLALEVEPDRIKVTTITLGTVMTDFGTRTLEQKRQSQQAGEKFMASTDVAHAVLMLLSQSDRAWTQELNLWPW